jgi:transmembrane sensor
MKLQRQIDRLLARRASEWHQILENASESQRAEFVAWLKQSPLHVQEYLETVYTDHVLTHVDAERLEDVDTLIAQVTPPVVELAEMSAAPERQEPRRRRWVIALATAAVVVLCVLLSPLIFKRYKAEPEYATALGEQRTIQLADSSIVTLNADSRIQLRLDPTRRNIDLLRGEALFKVAHDPSRPFTVQTKTAIVRAVGTQFNVYERPNGTRVSVLEGRVTITPLGNSGAGVNIVPATESLSAGQEAQVMPDGTVQRKANADVLKTVAWRERRLIFDDVPLEDMVYEFNRYNPNTRITLDGVPPSSHHYNGIFDAADPDSLADLLAKEPDLLVERRNGEIVIRKR